MDQEQNLGIRVQSFVPIFYSLHHLPKIIKTALFLNKAVFEIRICSISILLERVAHLLLSQKVEFLNRRHQVVFSYFAKRQNTYPKNLHF